MKMMRLLPLFVALFGLLNGCASLRESASCHELVVSTAFPGGSHSAVVSAVCDDVEVAIMPEVVPINPSPWYAFSIESETGGPVEIHLEYGDFEHRYQPWVQGPGDAWQRISPEQTLPSEHALRVALNIPAGRSYIAAQPLVTEQTYARWQSDWGRAERFDLGQSVAGRDVEAFRLFSSTSPGAERPLVIVLGRQHPPEVTGAFALDGFVEAALEAAEPAPLPFDLFIVPLLNPDGVEMGYWRTNAGGVDLNRDWSELSQPETRAVWQYLQQTGALDRDRIVLVDFHSTHSDRIYRDAYEDTDWRAATLSDWLMRLETRLGEQYPDVRVTRSASGQTAKSVFHGVGALAITWEAGDATNPELSRANGRQAMLALLEVMREE